MLPVGHTQITGTKLPGQADHSAVGGELARAGLTLSQEGVSISNPENCTLSGAYGKFRRNLEGLQHLVFAAGDVAFVVPRQRDAYGHSSTRLLS